MEVVILIFVLVIVTVVAIFLITGLMGAPYVPTLRKDLEVAFSKELYPLTSKDFLIDLGAGDGVVLEMATKFKARALGIEVNPILAGLIRFKFRKNSRAFVRCRNFYKVKFPEETTVVYVFAVGLRINSIYRKIEQEAVRLGHSIYFISNAFDLPGVKPVKKARQFYLYKVG